MAGIILHLVSVGPFGALVGVFKLLESLGGIGNWVHHCRHGDNPITLRVRLQIRWWCHQISS